MLAKYEPLHLFPVPSTMSASMRKALYPSGSKDDPRDADVLLDLLLQTSQQAAPFVAGHRSHAPNTKPGGGTTQAGG